MVADTIIKLLPVFIEHPAAKAASIVYEGVKEIMKEDPFEKAFKESIEKVRKIHPKYFAVFDILLGKPDEFLKTEVDVIDKETFCKILYEKGVIENVASELYDEIANRFEKIIKDAAKKNPKVFYSYVVEDLESKNVKLVEIKEVLNSLSKFTEIRLPEKIEEILEILREIKTLTKIEYRLKQYASAPRFKNPEFFRFEGPLWIDFEKDFVVKRDEVDRIIEGFKNKAVIAIKGAPASGKSVILRNVGYELADRNERVYVIELKQGKKDVDEDIHNLKKIGGYLLIDDVHLHKNYASDIVEKIDDGSGNVKVLLGSREIEKEHDHDRSGGGIGAYFEKAIEIKSYDAFEGIINKFIEKEEKELKKRGWEIPVPPGKKKELSKESLWVLAWQLRAYKETGDVDRDAICKEVEHYLEELTEQGVENAEDIFLILSVFYKYEILVRRKFVEKLVCGSKKDIEKLIKTREINETKEKGRKYLGLHHSEIAKVYLDLFLNQEFEGVGEEIKKKIEEETGKEDWSEELFHLYVHEFPEESLYVLNILCSFPKPISTSTEEILEKNFYDFKRGIDLEGDIEKIGIGIFDIFNGSFDYFRKNPEFTEALLSTLDFKKLKDKIENEKDVLKIGMCINGIARGSKKLAGEMVNSLNFKELKNKICSEDDIEKISWFILGIGRGSKEVAGDLIPIVKKRIDEENEVGKIGDCIELVCLVSKELAEELVNSLDLEKLKDKIDNEKDVGKICRCINMISAGSNELAEELVNSLDLERFKGKLNDEESVGKIGWCVGAIALVNEKLAKGLILIVSNKIEAEENVEEIGQCVGRIAWGSEDIAEKLIPHMKNKIEAEKDFEKIYNCVRYTYKVGLFSKNQKFPSKLVDQLNPENAKTPEVKNKMIELKKQYQT